MKKTIAKTLAMTAARQSESGSDLILNKDCCASDCGHRLSRVRDEEFLHSLCVTNQFGFNQPFYYQADLWKNEKTLEFREKGVGILRALDDGVHLIRETVFEHDFALENNKRLAESPYDFGDRVVTVGSFYPDDLFMKYYLPNTVNTSSGFVSLEPNEFLMADGEGNIKGGDVDDLMNILNTSKGGFQVGTTKPKKPVAGTIVFNRAKKRFEGFNGKEWTVLGG